jgi:hypothetical protein
MTCNLPMSYITDLADLERCVVMAILFTTSKQLGWYVIAKPQKQLNLLPLLLWVMQGSSLLAMANKRVNIVTHHNGPTHIHVTQW